MAHTTIRAAGLALALATLALLANCGGGGGGGSTGSNTGSTSNGTFSSGLAACPAGNEIFSVPPVALEQVRGWEPLGHMNPSAHTFPTDHQYLYTTAFGQPNNPQLSIPVVAPSDIRITQLYKGSTGGGTPDYSVFFQPCADLGARFGHVVTLTPELLAAAGPITQNCQTYQASPGVNTTLCQSAIFKFDVKAGQQVGTLGGGVSITLDWWLQDRRISPLYFTNPTRFSTYNGGDGFDEFHIVPASAYYTPAVAALIAPKLGRFDGTLQRTTAPTGGTIVVDVAGTARGYWFNPSQPFPPESSHAALVPDYVTPNTLQVFSLGVSQATGSLLATFVPVATGTVNRAFEHVTADGNVYCYEPVEGQRIVLVQLTDATTLKVDVRPGASSCAAAAPYVMAANAATYKR
ncbi:MAG: hypothetical protein HYX47_15100 [Burkholderiales bacterium]|nr:hypothetical protein [Burkholderiales bacterium]